MVELTLNISDAFEQSFEESSSFIDVQNLATNNSGFNKVILNNTNYGEDLNGKTINIQFYAKTSAEFPASSFKLRIKKGSTGNNYSVSNEIFLNDEYELKEVEFDIEEYYDVFKFQLMCGNELGHYYFDNFNVSINDNNMSLEDSLNDLINVYPNPTNGLINLNFTNYVSFEIFSINGKLINGYTNFRDNRLDLSYLQNGVYFIQFQINNKIIIKKIIKK